MTATAQARQGARAGETVLLRESGVVRWVRIVMTAPLRADGTQVAQVINLDVYGRAVPRRVTLGQTAHVEWLA